MMERFPPANGVLFLVLFLVALLYGRFLTNAGALALRPADLAGFAAAYCFFLMLRVFDEHKDYEIDCRNHPGRVLQRGLITLGHLKVVGAIAIVIQLAVSLALDGGFGAITGVWAIVMFWSTLMAFEFFAGEWLNKRLVLYAISHMVVMPMALVWMAFMGADGSGLSAHVIPLAALSFFSGFSFELARKTKAPEDERDGVDSYTKAFGVKRAPMVTLVLVAGGGIAAVPLLLHISTGITLWVWLIILMAAVALPITMLLKFRAAPSSSGAKKQEATIGLSLLLEYVLLITALFVSRGVHWG